MSLLPVEDDFELIHTRNYETRVYLVSDEEVLVRGVVSDRKPPGLYVQDDPDELEIHQMHVELRVTLPQLVITEVDVVFETHPSESCPRIVDHYQGLVGLSIARGFTHKVRELFGGPRGCTHTTALLQAMAPAVVQSTWSVSIKKSRAESGAASASNDDRKSMFRGNINTCHIWDEHGPHVAAIAAGEIPSPPLPVTERLVALGRKPENWGIG